MEKDYLNLLHKVLTNGEHRGDRTGTGTISMFGAQLRCNLSEGFPLLTTKKMAWKAMVGELLWFIEGSGDERRLAEITHGTRDGVSTIWTANALAPYWKPKARFSGDLGRVYGVQWRGWRTSRVEQWSDYLMGDSGETTYIGARVTQGSVDQLADVIDKLRNNPTDRRIILSAWNPGELDQMALPPCHMFAQFYLSSDRKLSCQMYMRSVDLFLGLPFNIASYALLTHMIAQVVGVDVGDLIITMGDAHIYSNHVSQVKEQLTRSAFPLPKLRINRPNVTDIDDFEMTDFELDGYECHPAISAKMAT